MALDAASLEAITQEIRACFLYEDAPDQLAVLEGGIRQLSAQNATNNLQAEYTALMRAAHSLKGGAGIAQFLTLSRLAHNLEDLLQALQQERVPDRAKAYDLLSLSVEQIGTLIAAATSTQAQTFDLVAEETTILPTLTQIEDFLQNLPQEGAEGAEGAEGEKPLTTRHSPLTTHNSPLATPSSPLHSEDTPETQGLRSLNLRMPVSRLDRIDNTIGELFISYERLFLYQKQLQQVDKTLKQRATQIAPLSEQVQAIYEDLVAPAPSLLSDSDKELRSPESADATKIHGTLQDMQELMVQVQEARADVDLISQEFRETLAELRQQLDDLRGDLTESRLVRFGLLATQLVAAQQTFSQRYNKAVELALVGKETPLDRAILEQLKIPLLHLFRNAFAHGIETPEERQMQGKSPTAKITLGAATIGNSFVVTLADDGRGIDIPSIQARAIELGMCDPRSESLTREQILEFLFQPGFSTTTKVNTFSGRGLGLDIVRLQVERLRGSVAIETVLGQGTTIRISIPLTLNILPLLLCKCHGQTLAIPAAAVKEVIALSEYSQPLLHSSTIALRDRYAKLYSLIHLLPYNHSAIVPPLAQLNSYLGLILEVNGEVIVLAVNSLLGERELVLKSFDLSLRVPAYVQGCTVLGTGEVVPVLSSEYFGELIAQARNFNPLRRAQSQNQTDLPSYSEDTAKILIVDDAIAFRRILERVLTASGYMVIQCRDGKEALEKLNSPGERFDLAIVDIEMPQIDGLELLRQIRSSPQWHSLPVIVLTSRENHQYRQIASNLGATHYFTKPFRQDELLEAIAPILSKVAI